MDLRSSGATTRSLPRPLLDGVTRFAKSLSSAPHRVGGLFAVGTASYEPWHLVAHLRDAAHWSGVPELVPGLIRHNVPADAPAHLAIGLDRVSRAGHGETLLVVAPTDPDEFLLERLADAKRHGSTVLALGLGNTASELASVIHDGAFVSEAHLEPAQHLLPLSAAGLFVPSRRFPWRTAGR
jgi:hypothetical protein